MMQNKTTELMSKSEKREQNMKNFHLYALITILCWSVGNTFTKIALAYFSPCPLAALRYVVAFVTFVVIALVIKMKLPQRKDLFWFIFAGATGFFGYTLAFNKGCETVTASTASVILAAVPVITALLANFIYKERLRLLQWAAIAVEFCGVAIMTLMNGLEAIKPGMLWVLIAALSLSTYNLIVRHLTKKYTSLQTSAFSIFAGAILLMVFLPQAVGEVRQVPPVTLIYVVFMGVFASALAYATWAKAFSKAPKTSQVSNYMFLTPFVTGVLEFFLTGAVPDLATILGGIVIFAGLFLFTFGGRERKRKDEISNSASE